VPDEEASHAWQIALDVGRTRDGVEFGRLLCHGGSLVPSPQRCMLPAVLPDGVRRPPAATHGLLPGPERHRRQCAADYLGQSATQLLPLIQ
jgi:hypothetical protein